MDIFGTPSTFEEPTTREFECAFTAEYLRTERLVDLLSYLDRAKRGDAPASNLSKALMKIANVLRGNAKASSAEEKQHALSEAMRERICGDMTLLRPVAAKIAEQSQRYVFEQGWHAAFALVNYWADDPQSRDRMFDASYVRQARRSCERFSAVLRHI